MANEPEESEEYAVNYVVNIHVEDGAKCTINITQTGKPTQPPPPPGGE